MEETSKDNHNSLLQAARGEGCYCGNTLAPRWDVRVYGGGGGGGKGCLLASVTCMCACQTG